MIGENHDNAKIKIESDKLCLAMRPRDAAKALGISERLLWEWTNRGTVPHVRLGRAILYPVDSLREWLRQQARDGTAEEKKI